jgi:hypothetical protein
VINRRWDSPGVADQKIGVSFSVAVVGTAAPAWKEPVYPQRRAKPRANQQ